MTKHLIVLVRLAGQSYRILLKTTEYLERFPLDRFFTAIELFIRWAETQQLPHGPGMAQVQQQPFATEPTAAGRYIVTLDAIESGYWMPREEAWIRLGIVKSTLELMLNDGELPYYHKRGDERKKKPRVWLKREEVEAYYHSYTLRKGKEKK